MCREPVPHGRVLGWLAALRLPPWAVLVSLLLVRHLGSDGAQPLPLLPVHRFVEPPLAHVLAMWIVLLVPIGLPLLYFAGGLLAHLGLTLTGGAPRSIGATMRAVGYSYGPALFVLGIADVPLHLGWLDGSPYMQLLGVVGLWLLWQIGIALSATHAIGFGRGFVVALCPTALLLAIALGRALLVLPDVPGLDSPDASPYFVP